MLDRRFVERYFPPPRRIRASVRQRSEEYLRENTLHGFAYFVNPRRPLWERIAWFVCTATSIAAVLAMIFTIWVKFDRDPVLMGIDSDTEDRPIHFPSVTVCQPSPDFRFSVDERNAEEYRRLYEWSWEPSSEGERTRLGNAPPDGRSYGRTFHEAAPECSELFTDCVYSGKPVECGEMFDKATTGRGPCCFLRARRITRETRPWAISFNSTVYPIGIELSEEKGTWKERESPFWYEARNGVSTSVSMIATYTTEALGAISVRRRACHLPDEYPSYEACLRECRIGRALESCGCVPWFYAGRDFTESHRECVRSYEYDCLRARRAEIRDTESCGCYLGCDHTSYAIESLEYREDGLVEISIANWPALVYKRDLRFDRLDLLVSFGGIAGLCLGYSILTSVELVYYFFLRTYCGAVLAGPADVARASIPADRPPPPSSPGNRRRRRRRRRRHRPTPPSLPDYVD